MHSDTEIVVVKKLKEGSIGSGRLLDSKLDSVAGERSLQRWLYASVSCSITHFPRNPLYEITCMH